AKILGAGGVFAVDIHEAKLAQAEQFGCVPVNAAREDAVRQIQSLTGGRGVDVALELIGLPRTMRQAVQSLAVQGRAALAGITQQPFEIFPYQEILNKEAEIVGVSDHLATELPLLLDWARAGQLDLQGVVTKTIPLDAAAINQTLDALDRFEVRGRTVIKPGN
ncbi:MAG TPA: zinc-binding dehydrogenase, partial [Verrucomicrobiae bacterium]|nr:zinc-binding dehydrogenase [Verrucomicrobiae bacterium]